MSLQQLESYTFTEKKDTRSGFGKAMYHLGETNEKVVALCADLTGSLKLNDFAKNHPDRFFQAGIAEANMIGVAAGLTIGGKIPFATTFANFATSRVFDQVRQSVAYSEKNVKIAASHSGLTLGEDGATHQVLEDMAMMKALPHMTVICCADYNQTYEATLAVADFEGPVYLRFGRPKMPVFMPTGNFEIGKAVHLAEGTDLTIVSTGHLVWESIEAAKELENQGISVDLLNIHTIKPLDSEAILKSAKKTGAVVVAEEHQKLGGLGGSVAQVLAEHHPTKMGFVAVNDQFGESGTPDQLMQKYGIYRSNIVEVGMALVNK